MIIRTLQQIITLFKEPMTCCLDSDRYGTQTCHGNLTSEWTLMVLHLYWLNMYKLAWQYHSPKKSALFLSLYIFVISTPRIPHAALWMANMWPISIKSDSRGKLQKINFIGTLRQLITLFKEPMTCCLDSDRYATHTCHGIWKSMDIDGSALMLNHDRHDLTSMG